MFKSYLSSFISPGYKERIESAFGEQLDKRIDSNVVRERVHGTAADAQASWTKTGPEPSAVDSSTSSAGSRLADVMNFAETERER